MAELEHGALLDGIRAPTPARTGPRNAWELVVIRKMVELFGGGVEFVELEGGGKRVTITFPVASKTGRKRETDSPTQEEARVGRGGDDGRITKGGGSDGTTG